MSVKSPYVVPVHELLHRPGEHREIALSFPTPEALGEGLMSVAEGADFSVRLILEAIDGGILTRGTLHTVATGMCGRCLEDASHSLELEFCELFAYSSDGAYDYEVRDDTIDLEQLVRDTVVLALPFQPVCRDDCAGLDPRTGEGLDAARLNAADEQLDPRWSALKDFRQKVDVR